MKSNYNIRVRIPNRIYQSVLNDLRRPHDYAYERVGFLFTKEICIQNKTFIVLATHYEPVKDENYIKDKSVGAHINSKAIREAMQIAMDNQYGCYHVHMHNHNGMPALSAIDKQGIPDVIRSFGNAIRGINHGLMIFSKDSVLCQVRIGNRLVNSDVTSLVGYPMSFFHVQKSQIKSSNIFDRQSFLGPNSQFLLENVRVCVIGYGGGGSHIGQQLSHLGVKNITVIDNDIIEDSNLNRLIGGKYSDIKKATPKTNIAKHVINAILPRAKPNCIKDVWQNHLETIQMSDIVIAGVDTYSDRERLEGFCRRSLIPYLDIGMDIHKIDQQFYISGQVILSMPGMCCMKCSNFINEADLGEEAGKYGNFGKRPQVVWSNGVLASTAIGVFVDIVTKWTGQTDRAVYYEYDGNTGTVFASRRLKVIDHSNCKHYLIQNIGPPRFKTL
ncbi:MAG: ThiF family adenylyltransferase [Bacteroidetes bacterium]|nr:ThiF family adenylyltransferase [Bacteroidota bacterium]